MQESTQDITSKLLTQEETAEKLAVSLDTLLSWSNGNILIPVETMDGKSFYSEQQVNKFLNIQKLVQTEDYPQQTDATLTPFNETAAKQQIDQTPAQENNELLADITQTTTPVSPQASTPALPLSGISNLKASKKQSFFPLVSSFVAFFFVLTIAAFSQAGAFKNSNSSSQKQTSTPKNVLGVQATQPKSTPDTNTALAAQQKKESILDDNQKELTEGTASQTQTDSTILKSDANTGVATEDVTTAATYASRVTTRDTENNPVFDNNGKIRGDTKITLATTLGGIGNISNTDIAKHTGTDLVSGLILLTAGIMSLFLVSPKRLSFLLKGPIPVDAEPQVYSHTASEKIIEVDQKTDGTIVLNFLEKEYKVSKPELYSESDQFIERLMELVRPDTKEIDYVSAGDEKIELTTPLSRLVTRLGFVGIKRELFFPRTSKDRVLFRKYLTVQDLTDMSLTTDQISRDLEIASPEARSTQV